MRRPIETHQIHLKPADFFTKNPAIDVPSTKNQTSMLHGVGGIVGGFLAELSPVPQNNKEVRQQAKAVVEDVVAVVEQGIKACCM